MGGVGGSTEGQSQPNRQPETLHRKWQFPQFSHMAGFMVVGLAHLTAKTALVCAV